MPITDQSLKITEKKFWPNTAHCPAKKGKNFLQVEPPHTGRTKGKLYTGLTLSYSARTPAFIFYICIYTKIPPSLAKTRVLPLLSQNRKAVTIQYDICRLSPITNKTTNPRKVDLVTVV
jgi:hypothetical protein